MAKHSKSQRILTHAQVWTALDRLAEHAYALEISGDSMKPAYRDGDVVIVSPGTAIRRGDRVVVKTSGGEVMVKELKRRTAKQLELQAFNPAQADRVLDADEVAWIARIVWASQ